MGAVIDGITAQGGNSARSIFESLQPAMLFDTVEALADIALAEIWTGRETMELALPPPFLKVEPGDVLIVGANRGGHRGERGGTHSRCGWLENRNY